MSRFFLAFWWVGLGRGLETFPQILKLDRPFVTGELPDNLNDLIMINTLINEQYLINFH